MSDISDARARHAITNPEGYADVKLQARQYRKALKHLGGAWRDPIHGTWVWAADDGKPLAHIRTLGIMLPKKDRRYALYVEGVLFIRPSPALGRTRAPMSSFNFAAYDSPIKAMKAGRALIERLRSDA
jgi:hypothetical protein